MSNGYDKYFKAAKKGNHKGAGPSAGKVTAPKQERSKLTTEEYVQQMLKTKAARKTSFPWPALFVVVVGLSGSVLGFLYPEQVGQYLDQIQFGVFGTADAADESTSAAKNSGGNGGTSADNSGPAKSADTKECTEVKAFTEEELSHFNKLNERKKELDLREAELSSLEEELHKQKAEIEARIQKLEKIRGDVATVLKERVEVDEQRVGTLVDFYSNMKPKQAAEIFGKLNEDLAVEVLGKMKKKNAAEIMNLLEPAKARVLSEKFAGYKRR